MALDARSGAPLWAVEVGAVISAGVGYDGRFAAVVTRGNELLVVEDGKTSWRSRVTAQVLTAPLVAGGRVFVLGADRSLAAYDAKTGRKLWLTQRPGEPLVLRQAGVLMAVGNTLIAGSSGHLLGVDPQNGDALWDVAVSTPRGSNDIERLVDLVGGASRSADVVCARSFQSNVSCVDARRGAMLWKKSALGSLGLSGDGESVYGVEDSGRLIAWRQSDGEQRWLSDGLRYRQLSAPLTLGRSVVVGDENGLVHFLARADGSSLTRLNTDGSAISVTPVDVGGTLVVVTRKGAVFGFQPD
jgi:outer membrane assembly lipoprotein YfgL